MNTVTYVCEVPLSNLCDNTDEINDVISNCHNLLDLLENFKKVGIVLIGSNGKSLLLGTLKKSIAKEYSVDKLKPTSDWSYLQEIADDNVPPDFPIFSDYLEGGPLYTPPEDGDTDDRDWSILEGDKECSLNVTYSSDGMEDDLEDPCITVETLEQDIDEIAEISDSLSESIDMVKLNIDVHKAKLALHEARLAKLES